MTLQLKICHDVRGNWSVHGLSPVPVSHLSSLSASIDYAREACGAAPASIELWINGFYAVIQQERGWPRRLLAPETERSHLARKRADLCGSPMWSRFLSALRGSRRLQC
jgi:hypothetical protein